MRLRKLAPQTQASYVRAVRRLAGDIDSTRMTLRIQRGKGGKDRYAMLSPVMLERLRTWWRVARAQGKMLEGGWLFPGLNPVEPLTAARLDASRSCSRHLRSAAATVSRMQRVTDPANVGFGLWVVS